MLKKIETPWMESNLQVQGKEKGSPLWASLVNQHVMNPNTKLDS